MANKINKINESKAQRVADASKEIAQLAKKPKLEYELERAAASKKLKVRVDELDKFVEAERKKKPATEPPKVDIGKLKASAKPITDSENVLDLFAKTIRARLAGESRNAKLLYLTYTSRLFTDPMNGVIKGQSAIGKSHLKDTTLAFMPEEVVVEFTTLAEKALFFLPDDLKHKILSMAEAEGAKEHQLQNYIIREMISKHRIRHMITVKDNETGEYVGRIIEKEGPISFVTSTTASALHTETETRVVTMETDDSEEQTRRVLQKIAEIKAGLPNTDIDFRPWHDFQRLLATGEHRVIIPYALALADLTSSRAVRMRRDFLQVLAAIEAHALLHREHRSRDQGRIVATIDDYAVVRDLMALRLAEASEARLRKPVREIVELVQTMEKEKEGKAWRERGLADEGSVPTEGIPTSAIIKRLDMDRTTVWRRLDVAREKGFLDNLEPKGSGRKGRWKTTGQSSGGQVLPTVEELEAAVTASAASRDACMRRSS
jgi:hypothetical protein